MRAVRYLLSFLATAAVWAILALYAGVYGWWLTPIAEEGDHSAFFRAAVDRLQRENHGVSALVLVEDGRVVAEHYGPEEHGIGPDTLFPLASLSKWIAAIGVMTLVESGRIDLDAPVSQYLTRWQLPESDSFDNDAVTVRRLLSHTAGLTDGLGFGDFDAEEVIPPLEESLAHPRASSAEDTVIAVGLEPGSEWLYSGGGYLVLELMLEEVANEPFSDYLQRAVFNPLEMTRSTYDFIEPLTDVAPSYDAEGTITPHFRYASKAATGLSSTAADLTRLLQAILRESIPGFLSRKWIEDMRLPHGSMIGIPIWGLGTILYVEDRTGEFVIGHDGVNDPAINTSVRLNPATGDGIVVLVTGHPTLASSIGSDWVFWQTGYPDILTLSKALKSAIVPVLIGVLLIFVLVGWRYRSGGR